MMFIKGVEGRAMEATVVVTITDHDSISSITGTLQCVLRIGKRIQ